MRPVGTFELLFILFTMGILFLFILQTVIGLLSGISRFIGAVMHRDDFIYFEQEIQEGPARKGTPLLWEDEAAGFVTAEFQRRAGELPRRDPTAP